MQDKNNSTQNNCETISNEPIEISQNVNDIKNMEFNSADDVRQTMKAIFTNTPNCDYDDQRIFQNHTHTLTSCRLGGIEISEIDKCHIELTNDKKQNTSQMVQTTELPLNKRIKITRKRPYRVSKGGPSIKQKKQSPSSMYLGKLSNVIRNRYESDSDY